MKHNSTENKYNKTRVQKRVTFPLESKVLIPYLINFKFNSWNFDAESSQNTAFLLFYPYFGNFQHQHLRRLKSKFIKSGTYELLQYRCKLITKHPVGLCKDVIEPKLYFVVFFYWNWNSKSLIILFLVS